MDLLKKKKGPDSKAQKKSGMGMGMKIGAIVIVVIIVIALYSLTVLSVNQTVVSAAGVTSNVTSAGALYSINSNQYYISLSSIQISSGKAYVHVSKLPIFLNPVLNVTLTLNNITKINVASNYSNVGLQLESISANSATVKITPLSASLQIKPDSGSIAAQQGSLYNGNQTTTTIPASNGGSTTVTATTTTGSSTAGSTTAASTATTVPKTNQTQLAILAALKQNDYYGLMLNFSVLYANTTKCTSQIYNSTYAAALSNVPKGQETYQNISVYTPYALTNQTIGVGGGNYDVVYKTETVSPLFNNTVALTLKVNVSTKTVLSGTTSGAYMDLGEPDLQASYSRAKELGGPCGIVIPP